MKPKQTIEYKRAVIYCRVSSDRQVKEGHGLDSQEQRCIQYAENKDLVVAKIFRDEGVSGKLFDRPAMQSLIAYLDNFPSEKFVIIFDDLARFSRDVPVHLQLKTELVLQRNARLECLNFNFEDSPTGRYVELIMVGAGQLAREQNAEQVKNKMKARLEAGYWTFCPPPGLKNGKHQSKGRILIADEPYARIYQEAIEKFRDYELNTLESVRQFILNKYSEQGVTKPLSLSGTNNILSNILYCGYLEYEKWGVQRQQAQHEGFITYDTYLSVQEKLANKAKPRLRKDYDKDFPLRGYVLCVACSKPMTAAWFKGNGGKYAYYKCKQEGCLRKNTTAGKTKVESEFEKLLNRIQPQPELLEFLKAVLNDIWVTRSKQELTLKVGIQKSLSELELKNATLMTRITQTTNHTMVGEYEKAVARNLKEIEELNLKLAKIKYSHGELQTALEVVLNFVKNPINQWQSGDYNKQRLLLQMYFEQKLVYNPEFGFQTIELPLILKLSQSKMTPKGHLVDTIKKSLNPIIEWIMNSYNSIKIIQDTTI